MSAFILTNFVFMLETVPEAGELSAYILYILLPLTYELILEFLSESLELRPLTGYSGELQKFDFLTWKKKPDPRYDGADYWLRTLPTPLPTPLMESMQQPIPRDRVP